MADALRKIARAYYERASEEEKNEVKQVIDKLDMNGDGKVTITEFRSCVSGTEADPETDKIFKELDSDGDGVLGLSDVLVLYYSTVKDKVKSWIQCDGCGESVFGDPYFSCVLCLTKYPQYSYDLCCDCYGRGKFDHCHPLTNFMHNHNMHNILKHHQEKSTQATLYYERASEEEKNEAKRVQIKTEYLGEREKMEDARRKIARAYYERASEEEKNEAKEFFSALDKNGDGKVTVTEFKILGRSPESQLVVDKMLKYLDSDGDGVLGFSDVLVFFYHVKGEVTIGIQYDGCRELLYGDPYFSCVLCLPKYPQSYDLCCDCYGRRKFDHCHPLTNFMHNQNHPCNVLKNHQEKTTQATLYYERMIEEEKNEELRAIMKNMKMVERGKRIVEICNEISINMMNANSNSAFNQLASSMMNGAITCTIM